MGIWERMTERARFTVYRAQEEARCRGQSLVAPEHLLLGLLHTPDCVACRILARLGLNRERLQEDLRDLLSAEVETTLKTNDMRLSDSAMKAISFMVTEARMLNNNYVGTEHLLSGLLAEGDNVAARLLARLGVTLEKARRQVMTYPDGE